MRVRDPGPGLRRTVEGALLPVLLLAACAGPRVELVAPEATVVYVDGLQAAPGRRPFSYYGTSQVDAVPVAEPGTLAEFTRVPAREAAELPEPVTPWLYPLDFPLEHLLRLFGGRPTLVLAAASAPNPMPVTPDARPPGMEPMRSRALAARVQR